MYIRVFVLAFMIEHLIITKNAIYVIPIITISKKTFM